MLRIASRATLGCSILFQLAVSAANCAADPAPLLAMSGPLAADPDPVVLDSGPLGPVYVTGAVSGLAFGQTNPLPGDRGAALDLSNAQFMVQNTAGWLQFFVQAGAYALPALGGAYATASRTPRETYGWAPIAFLKLAPSEEISIEAGKLPSMIGNESTFTFENFNIERGLLWNQTSSVSRGAQVNYAHGPLTLSLSWNDGYYSGRFNWVTGLATYALAENGGAITVSGGANFGHTGYSSFATPLAQNNSTILDIAYSATAGRWTFSPYVQASRVAADAAAGLENRATTFGAAVLASYRVSENWSIAARGEALASQGSANLLYGPGSSAWSLTLTPTYQEGVFFARAEASYVGLTKVAAGAGLGRDAGRTAQARVMLEAGVLP